MKLKSLLYLILLSHANLFAQQNNSSWRATLHRPDSVDIVFGFTLKKINKKPVMFIVNGVEKMKVDNIIYKGDSVFINMPFFESSFKAKVSGGKWKGLWTRGSTSSDISLPFEAIPNKNRFELLHGKASSNVSGRWKIIFATDRSKEEASVGEFMQKGNKLTGSILTPSGDYRYLEGIVSGNELVLSGFDGIHALLFKAELGKDHNITNGVFYSGAKFKDHFSGIKDSKATVNTDIEAMFLRPGENRLDFKFPDLDSNIVSIHDKRFENKVVIIQLMGSWCPNCMDETAFLSPYYFENKQRGIEMIALAYEYSTDFRRSVKSLTKFKDRFNVKYPILVTGVRVSDSLRTEKTLPQVTPIKVFPSTIFIDKTGRVRKFNTGFFGPGTGAHYEDYKLEFIKTLEELLKEGRK